MTAQQLEKLADGTMQLVERLPTIERQAMKRYILEALHRAIEMERERVCEWIDKEGKLWPSCGKTAYCCSDWVPWPHCQWCGGKLRVKEQTK